MILLFREAELAGTAAQHGRARIDSPKGVVMTDPACGGTFVSEKSIGVFRQLHPSVHVCGQKIYRTFRSRIVYLRKPETTE